MSLRRTMLALAVGAAASVQAQSPDPELLDLSLEDLLDVQVASASWGESPLRDAPGSLTVFERADLERMGFRSLHEVLDYVPGAYTARVATTGLEQRTVLRGNPGTAGGGLLVIDGQRINTQQNVRAWGVLRQFPLALVERIEVLRGPGAARFGGGAADEVVNVVTRRGHRGLEARASAEGGRAAQAWWSADLGEARLDMALSDAADRSPAYERLFDRFGRITRSREEDDTRTAMATASWDRHEVQVAFHESAIAGYYGLRGSIDPADDNTVDATWWRYAGGVAAGGWDIGWTASRLRQRYALGGVVAAPGVPPFADGGLRQRGLLTHRVEQGSLTLRRAFGDHTLTIGGEALGGRTTRADLQVNRLTAPPFTAFGGFRSTGARFVADGARDRLTATYLEDDWAAARDWRVVAGLRHDRFGQGGSATSPRLAVVWRPAGDWGWKLLYQEAFFAPTLGQLFLQNNPVIRGNPDLAPSLARTLELVATWERPTMVATATLYRRHAHDGFVVVPGATPDAPSTTANASRQDSAGLEASATWQPAAAWRLTVNASTLFRDRYDLPATIAEVPPGQFVARRTASAWLQWRPAERWDVGLGAAWRSREPLQVGGHAPRVRLQLAWTPTDDLRLWLHAGNLTDAEGSDVDPGSGLGTNAAGRTVRALPWAGREVDLGLAWRWR